MPNWLHLQETRRCMLTTLPEEHLPAAHPRPHPCQHIGEHVAGVDSGTCFPAWFRAISVWLTPRRLLGSTA